MVQRREGIANGETLVGSYLAAHRLTAARFDKAAKRQSRTPDFCVMAGHSLAFYCEVKTVQEDEWLDQQLARVAPGTPAGGSRPDPTYNRISNHVHGAIGQFDAVNAGYEYPNVLVFVNYDFEAGSPDLLAVLTGNAYCESGEILPWYRNYSEGRIREEKDQIHLYLWFDVDQPEPKKFWMQSHEAHHMTLCRYFGIDPRTIKQI
jgi:hypothetical protein